MNWKLQAYTPSYACWNLQFLFRFRSPLSFYTRSISRCFRARNEHSASNEPWNDVQTTDFSCNCAHSRFSGHPSVVIVRNVLVKQAIFHETVNEPTKVSILPFVFVSYPFPPNCIADLLVHSIQVKYFRTREGKTFGQWNAWSSGIVWEGYNVYPSLWKPYLEGGYIPS